MEKTLLVIVCAILIVGGGFIGFADFWPNPRSWSGLAGEILFWIGVAGLAVILLITIFRKIIPRKTSKEGDEK